MSEAAADAKTDIQALMCIWQVSEKLWLLFGYPMDKGPRYNWDPRGDYNFGTILGAYRIRFSALAKVCKLQAFRIRYGTHGAIQRLQFIANQAKRACVNSKLHLSTSQS